MAAANWYECDVCGKHGGNTDYRTIPLSWYEVWPSGNGNQAQYFCSKECGAKFFTDGKFAAVAEPASALFWRWVKALVG